MWQKLLDFARFLWNQGEETRLHTRRIAELEEEIEVLSSTLARAVFELSRTNDRLEHLTREHQSELEKVELRLRLELSEKLRQLPPSRSE